MNQFHKFNKNKLENGKIKKYNRCIKITIMLAYF